MAEDDFERFKHEMHDLFVNFRRGRHTLAVPLGDLTTGESGVLITIAHARRHAKHVRPRMVAHMANMTPSALSQMLKSLETKGYVVRERFGEDSRGIDLRLTEKGLQLARQGERMRDDYLRELFSYLGDDDVADLTRVVRRMNEFFETKRADASQGGEVSAFAEQAVEERSLRTGQDLDDGRDLAPRGGEDDPACASRDGEDGPACA